MMASAAIKRTVLTSLLATFLIWLVLSWPLPRHVFSGIPASAHNVEKHNARRMLAGDHLQLHYFYWLFSDMLVGETDLWHNPYEFNTGDEEARRQAGNYNMPFSILYTAGRVIGGAAFAWNLTIFFTIWGSLLLSWLLVRRYTHENTLSFVFALLSIIIPYRWITLFGGSPTGFAFLWVPLLLLGLDMAGRDDSIKGGMLAALALLFTYGNDPHTFFFGVLFIPVGYLAGFLRRTVFPWQKRGNWLTTFLGAAPIAATVLGLAVLGMAAKSATFDGTTMEAGRSLAEVLIFTPRLRGILGWHANNTDIQIFIGYALPVFFGLHLVALPYVLRHKARAVIIRHVLLVLLLYGAVASVALLAMGPHAPFSAVLFKACRRFIPGYEMIRQTAKIYVLMPTLLAVVAAVAGMDLMACLRRRAAKVAICVIPILLAGVEASRVMDPTVCLLDRSQGAYEAVHLDAQRDPDVEHAHVVVIPLWPGDSHWASLYQHYASLYRIRMFNGYSPIVSHWYRELITERFENINSGLLDDEQLPAILEMGINYVIFHEDAFPERISAHPAYFTLQRLLRDPRLDLLAQDGSVWAFRIRPSKTPVPDTLPDGPHFPSRRWNAMAGGAHGGRQLPDASVWGGNYARVEQGEVLSLAEFNHMFAPEAHLWIRLRGDGVCRFQRFADDPDAVLYQARNADWTWFPLPLPMHRQEMHVSAEILEGAVEFDLLTLMSGHWSLPEPGETVSLPGCLFFRAGYTDLKDNSAVLRPEYEAASNVFYGPRLPLHAGMYRIALQYDSDAPTGTLLGDLILQGGISTTPVLAGGELHTDYEHSTNLPFELQFVYTRNGGISIQSVDIEFVTARPQGQ